MRLPLGLVLSMSIAGLQFIAVLIVVSSSYLSSERALLHQARALLDDVAYNTKEHSVSFLEPAQGAVELASRLAQNEIVAREDSELLEKLLFQQLQVTPQFAGVFYGDQEGNFVYVMRSEGPGPFRSKMIKRAGDIRETTLIWRGPDYDQLEKRLDPEDSYDPRQRPWYKRASEKMFSIWTDPYIFFTSQKPGITVASPVIGRDGKLQGVIGVDIEIDAISDFLAKLRVGENGKALILNHNGDVIAHPDPDLTKTKRNDGSLRFTGITEIDDPVSRTAFSYLFKNDSIVQDPVISGDFEYGGAKFVSTITQIENETLPWTIGVFAPEDDFIGGIKANRQQNIWLAAAIAALTALIGLMVARRIHRPVKALAHRATEVSRGVYDLSEPFPRTFIELEQANDTMMEEVARRKKTEAEYGRTFDLASRGMAQVSPQTGQFLRVNDRLCEILGFTEHALLSMSLSDIWHPDDIDQPTFLADTLSGNTEVVQERCIMRGDKNAAWVQLNAIMIHDESGPQHAVLTVDDITEKHANDAKIKKLNQDLARQERLNTMGEMAASLAHELNQPLTAITQNADAALSTAKDIELTDQELLDILKDLDQQAHRAGDIIRALRSFVRKDDETKSTFSISELIDQTVRLMQAEARENGVRIIVRAPEVGVADGSYVQIAQVLVNLIRNAIEAIAPTKDNQRLITIVAQQHETSLTLSVSDTGPGIDPGIELFGKFETTKADGMGLGLPISRAIIEQHGGRLWYEKSDDAGGSFCLTIPSRRG